MIPTPKTVTDEWFDLIHMVNDDFDPRDFRTRHDQLARTWARLGYSDQGEVSHLISEKMSI